MKVARLEIDHFRGVEHAVLDFDGHTLMVGENNVGKSTICEALEIALGAERLHRHPVAQEHDFYNSDYVDDEGRCHPIRIGVTLIGLSDEVVRLCAANLEHWHKGERRLLDSGELDAVDGGDIEPCLRVRAEVCYDAEEDDFQGATYYVHPDPSPEPLRKVPQNVKRAIGFLYLRALRTGSRAFSLERGTLLDIILRLKNARTSLWEKTRQRLKDLDPPIDDSEEALQPILEEIEKRIAEYIPIQGQDRPTRLFVSQLTREHLRRTIAFFLALAPDQEPIPFQQAGTGTLNVLVLALLTFIAEAKQDVIFAMEEPEIALPPHTQRRIIRYLLAHTGQSFVTTHSPYVIECFSPDQIVLVRRSGAGQVEGKRVSLPAGVKPKTYRMLLRRVFAEAMLGRAVIVAEGLTEQLALRAAADLMEEADPARPALDLSGTTIVNSGGDGNIGEVGAFFKDLGLKTFAFYDNKTRPPAEVARIATGFDVNTQTVYPGAEQLLAAEVPVARQWQFLEERRVADTDGKYGIPVVQPDEPAIRRLTQSILKATKGEGTAAALLSLCEVGEIPVTITSFLSEVYARTATAPPPPSGAAQPMIVAATPEPAATEE